MKVLQQKSFLVLIITAVVFAFAASIFWGNKNSNNILPDPLLVTKAQVLALASSGNSLTLEQKQFIYRSLVGPVVFEYNFNQVEKSKIIQALNN